MPPTPDPAAKPAAEPLRESREDFERVSLADLHPIHHGPPGIAIRDYPPTGPVTVRTEAALEALQAATLEQLQAEAERCKATLAMIRAVIKHKQRQAAKRGT